MSGGLSAPGKLFLAGEYAVLDRGRPALVAAVDRFLHLEWRGLREPLVELLHRPSGFFLTGELQGDPRAPVAWRGSVPAQLRFAARATEVALRLCAEEGLAPRGYFAGFLDDFTVAAPAVAAPAQSTTAMRALKPGLGGSAAASVLAVRAACAAQGRALQPSETLVLALAAHWAEQGGSGSGADVAASALGGALVVRVRHDWSAPEALLSQPVASLLRSALEAPPLETRQLLVPADLRLLLAFSGQSADTRSLVAEVRRFAAARPARWEDLAGRIAACAEALASALEAAARDPGAAPREGALQAVRDAAAAMGALGDEAGVPIVTPELARACALAASAGAAAKPSGAGGGDCAVALAFGDAAAAKVEERLAGQGVPALRVAVAPAQ